jgi:hypothetical protein
MKNDELLDRAIDHVARGLTDGSPRQGFAGRVRERIEAPSAKLRWMWPIATGAAAAIILLVWLALPTQTVTPTVSPIGRAADRILQGPTANREAPRVAGTIRPNETRHPRARMTEVRIPIDTENAPQLAAITPPDDLAVQPIEIAELTIAPLEPEKESR